MNYQEYFKCSTMTYREYCKYLQDKYGIPKNSYYNEQYNKNRNSRTSEGLVIHHICEDIKPNLCNKEVAKSCDFNYQLPENLCYCDYLEHLFLHILITEYPNEETDDVVGIGGSANYLIPELNNLFSGYIPEQSSKKYVINCFNRVKDDFITYKYLISRFLSNNDVPKESLVNVVLSGNKNYFNEESKIYSELKNICDSGSCIQSHNIEIYSKVESLLNAQNKALLVLGTGLGKTSTALSYALKYGYRVLVVCPRDNIKDTWEIYSPVVNTISYVSLANEAETFDYSKYDLIVFDEAHHLNAPVWGKGIRHLLDNNVNIKILGLTATPLCDGGKKNIADIFFKDCTVVGYDAIEGIKAGVLHPVSYVCSFYTKPKEIDEALEKCKESTDELTMKLKGRLDLALNNTPTLKEIITSNMPHGNRKGIIFAQTIEDMDEAIKILKDIYPNEKYRKIHSLMNREEVQNIKEWFSNTDSGYLCTVDMISEGSHYKGVNTIFMFRKTKSGNLFEQQLGRCMTQTSLPNPHCIVFDLVNNMRNVREFTARLADAISRHGIVKTLKGERQVNPDVFSGGAKISEQCVVEDYTQDIVDAYDEINRLLGGFWTEEEVRILKKCAFHQTWEELSKCLRRPIEGVKSKAYELGLRKGINVVSKEILTDVDGMIRCGCTFEEIHSTFPFIDKNYFTNRKRKIFGATLSIKPVTEYEKAIILNDYPTKGRETLSLLPGRNVEWLQSTASRLGVKLNPAWTSDMDNVIKEKYAEVGAKGIHRIMPEKSVSQIADRAVKLGVKFDSKRWSKEEDEVLKNFWVQDREKVLQLLPKRTLKNCQQRAIKMGLLQEGYYWTDEEIATLKKYYVIGGKYEVKKHLTTKSISQIASKASALKLKSPNHKKRIKCIETNEVYESASEAMKQTGIKTIDMCARGKCKTAGGYHWGYIEEENEE